MRRRGGQASPGPRAATIAIGAIHDHHAARQKTNTHLRSRMQRIPRWAVFVIGTYAGVGLLTLVFQTYVRLDGCSGYPACTISIAKGVVWSAVWPAYWIVYETGRRRLFPIHSSSAVFDLKIFGA